jgi:hypothetical protein
MPFAIELAPSLTIGPYRIYQAFLSLRKASPHAERFDIASNNFRCSVLLTFSDDADNCQRLSTTGLLIEYHPPQHAYTR